MPRYALQNLRQEGQPAALDLTHLAHRAGLPHPTFLSFQLAERYGLKPDSTIDEHWELYDLMWAASLVLHRQLPCNQRCLGGDTFYDLELLSLLPGSPEPAELAVTMVLKNARSDSATLHLMLPGELPEPARPRLLVAEGDATIASVLELMLQLEGFDVFRTDTGAATLELARQQPFDLLLLDVDLPDFDAFALCSRLQADPATRQLPVVICSAWHGLGGWAAQVGAVAWVEKPLDLVQLPERLRQLLKPAAKKAEPKP